MIIFSFFLLQKFNLCEIAKILQKNCLPVSEEDLPSERPEAHWHPTVLGKEATLGGATGRAAQISKIFQLQIPLWPQTHPDLFGQYKIVFAIALQLIHDGSIWQIIVH